MIIIILTSFVILWTAFFDSAREALFNASFWKAHIPKWLHGFPIIIWLMIVAKLPIWLCVILAILSWVIWRISIKYIFYKDWISMWIRLYKIIFRK